MQRPIRTYEQAIEYLFGRINYERAQVGSYSTRDFKLDRMRRLLRLLGDPHEELPVVHIAGTKGKGSTAVMIAEMLSAAGSRAGLFTSPHVSAFEERMTVDGVPPCPRQLVELVNRVADSVAAMDKSPGQMNPTYFEIATAMAWLHFLEQQVQLVVLEVGLGGRLDATNICHPEVSVITNISHDHTALLGNTLARIAREKAGIIKPAVPVVSGVADEDPRRVVEEVCREQNSELLQLGREVRYSYLSAVNRLRMVEGIRSASCGSAEIQTPHRVWSDVPLPLAGEHQAANAAIAVAVVDLLAQRGRRIPPHAVYAGMARVKWPVRIEVLGEQPTVIVDAAHNWASAAALLKTLKESFPARRRILIFAATRDKDVSGMFRQLLPEFDAIVLTRYLNNPRAVPLEQLRQIVQSIGEYHVHLVADPATAWKLAVELSTADDLVCVTGSFFIAAEMRELILEQQSADGQEDPQPGRTVA